MYMEQRFAAHEFLETQEAVRTKGAQLELYGILYSMAQDAHLKDILFNQQSRMLEGCIDPQIRQYHATSSNICQEMAWEMFQYMNDKGYYQAPQLADHTMRTMIQGIQPSQQQQALAGYSS